MSGSLVLHIGAGKTGSSAIQRFLQRNHLSLRNFEVIVPDENLCLDGRVTGNQVFKVQNLVEHGDLAEALRLVAKSVPDHATVVVSAENLSNPNIHEHVRGLQADVPTRAILYVRRQDDLLASAWQQWHSKTRTDVSAWLFDAVLTYGRWADVANGWLDVLGEDNLEVRIFERNAFEAGDLLVDFLAACDLRHLHPHLETKELGKVNPSYSDAITALVAGNRLIFNDSHDNDFYRMVGELTGDRHSTGSRISLFSADQRDAIVRHYSEQNEFIRSRFFPRRAQLFEPVDHSKYEYLTADEMQDRQLRFLGDLITGLYRKIDHG